MNYLRITFPDGKERGLKFNTLTYRQWLTYTDFSNYAFTANYALVFGALYSNCYTKREEVDFSFEQVCEWVDQMSQEDLNRIADAFAELDDYKKLLESAKTEEEKKETDEEKKSESENTLTNA